MKTPLYFTKVTTDVYNEFFVWANKNPLRWAVLMTIAARVSSKDQITTGIKKGEFIFSQTEYKKFGLKKTESGKLYRIIIELLRLGVIQKTDNVTDNYNAVIYRFNSGDFIDCSRGTDNETDTEQITNRYRIDNEQIHTKNDKNVINKEIKKNTYKDNSFKKFEQIISEKGGEYFELVKKMQEKGVDSYTAKTELDKFYSYWSEHNSSGKMRYESQPFFEVSRRLATWFVNVKNRAGKQPEKKKYGIDRTKPPTQ